MYKLKTCAGNGHAFVQKETDVLISGLLHLSHGTRACVERYVQKTSVLSHMVLWHHIRELAFFAPQQKAPCIHFTAFVMSVALGVYRERIPLIHSLVHVKTHMNLVKLESVIPAC